MSSNNEELERDRWKKLEQIFHTASDLEPEERDAYLVEICSSDQDLLVQARDLLRSSDTADDFIEGAIGGAFDQVLKEQDQSRKNKRLGAYRIIDIVGRGGMGTVYLADRADDQYRQKVAIKLVKGGLFDKRAQVRLKAERQILANLDHPNIARLLDGGSTDDGDPYLVMEYIDGEPLMDFCDRRRLGIRERLELFRSICSAVQYAHRNLVVHRDLKPSNILVTEDGVPKLLDFGIAKLLDVEQTSYTVALTQENMRLLTPDYASPEQVRGDAITTASDVYALGILLYELITGRKLFELSGCRHGELLKIVCEKMPQRPAEIVGEHTGDSIDAALLAKYRNSTPERLRRRLKGDIDNIVLVALRKEPERRYESVQQFSEDIRRHLTELPVVARPDTLAYRSGKFLRRHAVGVGMAATLVLLLAGFGVNAYVQAQRFAEQRDEAQQTIALLLNMFKESDPAQHQGQEMTVSQLLEAGSRITQTQLSRQPETRALFLEVLGSVQHSRGFPDKALPLLEESLSLRLELFGYDHPQVASSLVSLAGPLLEKGDFERAESSLDKAMEINLSEFPRTSEPVARNLLEQGRLYAATDRYKKAEESLRESIAIYTSIAVESPDVVSSAKNQLAMVLVRLGRNDEAEQLYLEILQHDREVLGINHPQVMEHNINLAVLYLVRGDYDDAKPHYEEAIRTMNEVLGGKHPDTIATRSMYGRLLIKLGDHDAAESILRNVLALRAEVHGRDHFKVGLGAVVLAEALQEQERYAEAETLYRKGLDNYASSLPADHHYIGAALMSLGSLHNDTGRFDQALMELESANRGLRVSFSEDHIYIAKTEMLIGEALIGLARFDEAEAYCQRSWAIIDASRNEDDPLRQQALGIMIKLYESWEKPERAREYRVHSSD